MEKMKAETKAQIKEAIRHPVVWWKGADLPEEKIRPWESGIQFFAESVKGFMKGFVGMKNHYYIGSLEKGKIPPNWDSVHKVAVVAWDAVNNPIVGSFMDRKRYGERAHRWIMRFNATLSPLLILLQCFNFGMTPMQRIVFWTTVALFANLMSATNLVSETKIWAGITPQGEQRGKVQVAKTVGNQMSDVFNAIPMAIMGMKSLTGLSDYQVIIYGALIFAPVAILSRWLPSYAKQRVDFTVQVKGEDQKKEEPAERQLTLRETFDVVKHNRWFMLTTAANMIRMFFPETDYMYQYVYLFPTVHLGGKPFDGRLIWTIKNFTFGLPCLLLQPFANKIVAKFKDKPQFMKLQELFTALAHIGMYLACYSFRKRSTVFSWPRIFLLFTIEMFRGIIDNVAKIPRDLIMYEMLDYVEWKTGQRGEGVTMALDRMLNGAQVNSNLIQTSVKDNVKGVISNAVKQRSGFQGFLDVEAKEQPQSFLDSIWPLTHWGKIAGGFVGFIALLFFRYPQDPKEVEADLIERRAIAQQMKEEAELLG